MNRCDNCVHFAAHNSQLKLPVCNKFGFPLAKSDVSPTEREQSFIRIGSNCPSFENGPADNKVTNDSPVVGIPLPVISQAVSIGQPTRTPPASCGGCRYFVGPAEVMGEFGFNHGMCAAKAELIPSTMLTRMAAVCDMGDFGDNRTSTDGVLLDERYNAGSPVVDLSAKRGQFKGFDPFHHARTDPREWVSDLPVTDDEIDFGVRAWRLVHDPKGNFPPIPMPIFDWSTLTMPCVTCDGEGMVNEVTCTPCLGSGQVRAMTRDPRTTYGDHKPWLYVDHAGILYTAAFMMMGGLREGVNAINRALLLEGDAGTGKTEFWCYFAWLMDLPFHRLSLRPDTEADDFFGKTDVVIDPDTKQQVTKFKLGRFTRAYREPGVICLDEPNAASDSIWFLLRPCLDSAGQLAIESEDVIFERNPLCFIGLAANPARNPAYRGTRPLSPADFERMAHRWVDLPDPETERAIIRTHCESIGYEIPESIITKLLAIGGELRDMYRDDMAIQTPWGIRPQVAVAAYTWSFTIEDAFRLAVLDGMDPQEAEIILGVVRSHA